MAKAAGLAPSTVQRAPARGAGRGRHRRRHHASRPCAPPAHRVAALNEHSAGADPRPGRARLRYAQAQLWLAPRPLSRSAAQRRPPAPALHRREPPPCRTARRLTEEARPQPYRRARIRPSRPLPALRHASITRSGAFRRCLQGRDCGGSQEPLIPKRMGARLSRLGRGNPEPMPSIQFGIGRAARHFIEPVNKLLHASIYHARQRGSPGAYRPSSKAWAQNRMSFWGICGHRPPIPY